jgi:tRNA(Arg) A34 adenosine deaminase TadA
MHVIRIFVLMSLLVLGAYATHVANRRVESYKSAASQTSQWRKGLSEADYAFMRVALDSGNRANAQHHGHASACIIVKNNSVIGTGLDSADTDRPGVHTVLKSVLQAFNTLGKSSLEGCVLYSTTRPCAACLSLLDLSKVEKVVYMVSDSVKGGADEAITYPVQQLSSTDQLATVPQVPLFPIDLR